MAIVNQSARSVVNWSNVYDSQGFGNNGQIVEAPCALTKLVVTNSSMSLLYCFVFDATSATGTPRIPPIAVPATSTVVVDLSLVIGSHGAMGSPFSAGPFWAASTAASFDQDSSDSMWVGATFLN